MTDEEDMALTLRASGFVCGEWTEEDIAAVLAPKRDALIAQQAAELERQAGVIAALRAQVQDYAASKYGSHDDWVVFLVDTCTGGGCGVGYGHEPTCGMEPLARCVSPAAAQNIAQELNGQAGVIERVRQLHVIELAADEESEMCRECGFMPTVGDEVCPTIRALDGGDA